MLLAESKPSSRPPRRRTRGHSCFGWPDLGDEEFRHTLVAPGQDSLKADTKFLADVKAQCANFDAKHAERTKTCQMETEAMTKAIKDAEENIDMLMSKVQESPR